MNVLRTLLLGLAWLAAAVLIALGAAGIVASMNHVPGTSTRPELTWTGDRAAEPAMSAATGQLEALSTEVDELGDIARRALTEVVAGDVDALSATIGEGTAQVGQVKGEASELERRLAAVPGAGAARIRSSARGRSLSGASPRADRAMWLGPFAPCGNRAIARCLKVSLANP